MLIGIIQFIIWLLLMTLFGIGLVCVLLTDPITMRKEARKKVEEQRKNREKVLTNARKCVIINTESEETTMTREEIIEALVDGYIRYHEEHPCDHFGQICPNYINQTCTCNYDYADCEKYVKNLLTNSK